MFYRITRVRRPEERTMHLENILDAFGEEVSGLGGIVGDGECTGPLFDDTFTRGGCLENNSKESNHSKTSMLDLLKLLLGVLRRGVVEAERVPASLTLSPGLRVSGDVTGALGADVRNTLELKGRHESADLEESRAGNSVESQQRVGLSEVNAFGSGDGSPSRGDETKSGNHTDSAVHELSLTVPGKAINGSITRENAVEVRGNTVSLGGKEARVKANITNHGSVEHSRGEFTRDGSRSDDTRLFKERERSRVRGLYFAVKYRAKRAFLQSPANGIQRKFKLHQITPTKTLKRT
jgi:hypothetical protein